MPNYVYKAKEPGCDSCEHGFTVFQQIQDAPLASCPECMASIYRAIQNPTVINNTTWYDEPVYMSQLADQSDPNPRANSKNYVSGPHSLARKVNEAQRAGVRIVKNADDLGDASPREIKKRERHA